MLIVLEGLDRTGKSTLAEELAAKSPASVVHFDKPEQHPLDEYLRPIERPIQRIFDRYHVGELVWPEVFERTSEFDPEMRLYVELALNSRGAVVVHTQRNMDELKQALKRDQEALTPEKAGYAASLFAAELLTTGNTLPVYRTDIKHRNHDANMQRVTGHARLRYADAVEVARYTPRYVGALRPVTLLVGDRCGPGSEGWDLPFVPYRNTSGHFLMSELLRDPAFARHVGIVNSTWLPEDGVKPLPEKLHTLWLRLGRPRVVAMGREAEHELTRQNVPYGKVNHPQYVRRFLRDEGPGWYLQQLKTAQREEQHA